MTKRSSPRSDRWSYTDSAARPDLAPELVEQRVHRLRLEQAALDVEDDVVALGLRAARPPAPAPATVNSILLR